ncbi:Glycosyltransferase Family 31 protein [Gigaspora rosea]|uniref:Hexosyltransferase n=1 Tax=Gigaspora rosea TaxID=44941 RepID=A0A397VUE0_9GLOM|nr:Glycosyltransferase Family 31 protein [Gigaspora rosea]
MHSSRSIIVFIGVFEIVFIILLALKYYNDYGINKVDINKIDDNGINKTDDNKIDDNKIDNNGINMIDDNDIRIDNTTLVKKPYSEKEYLKELSHLTSSIKKKQSLKKGLKSKKPSYEEISSYQNKPIPFKAKMECKSYHEKNGIHLGKLWSWPSVRIFIGIWSIAKNNVIRNLIRTLYLKQKKDLIDDNVDFKFILGKSNDKDLSQLISENDTYGDIIILDIKENMNNGKAYYYWQWVGLNINTSEYDYAAKTDDDSFVHFQNMALNLRPLPRDYLYYGHIFQYKNMSFARGLLQVLSINYAHVFTSIQFNKKEWNGPEDMQLGLWLDKYTNSTLNQFNEDCLMFHDPRVPINRPIWRHWASPHTIVIHWLKDINAWKSIVDFYFLQLL